MPDLWFFEQLSILGHWMPVTVSQAPDTHTSRNGSLRLGQRGDGPIVRGIVLVPPDYHKLTLAQLQALYGAAGHLQAAGRSGGAT